MNSSKKKSSTSSVDSELASLVSSIKKNVGSLPSASPSSQVLSASSKTSGTTKSRSKKSDEKRSIGEEVKELRKKAPKEKLEKPKKKVENLDDIELPPPVKRKRSREEAELDGNVDEEHWDETFEKDDIEDIFGQLKSNKEARAAADKKAVEEQDAIIKLLERASDRSANNSVAIRTSNTKRDPNRKHTEDGFPIYTPAELGLNEKGGDTALCPFDCQCCF
jgi:hypothetical protein